MSNIILGVTGSIAVYKAAEIANLLTKSGHSVHVIMTTAAQKFVTPLTFQTLTKNRVYTEMFDEIAYEDVRHISLAKGADAVIAAPASANLIGKLAGGIADDMLTTVMMAAWQKPTLICPAMNTAMYESPATQANIQTLTNRGVRVVEPREAVLACGDLGRGALASVDIIVAEVAKILEEGKISTINVGEINE
jgi:phosphopantothenoylcysteine decarboxylase/phosphopantothenoylcysteine decarboxylase/phosphopantothenate--cysteine ligase